MSKGGNNFNPGNDKDYLIASQINDMLLAMRDLGIIS